MGKSCVSYTSAYNLKKLPKNIKLLRQKIAFLKGDLQSWLTFNVDQNRQ